MVCRFCICLFTPMAVSLPRVIDPRNERERGSYEADLDGLTSRCYGLGSTSE